MTRTNQHTGDRFASWAALALCALARLPGLLLGVEHYGDAPVRVEIAERWARSPHLFRGFSETWQYGPLHLAMLGGALRLWPDRLLSPRLLSFFFALLGVWILYWLARRVTSTAGALLAASALALDTVHIQAGSSSASEDIFLAMLLGTLWLVLDARERLASGAPGRSPSPALLSLASAGLLLGAASLVRYDGLLYAALLCALLALDLYLERKQARAGPGTYDSGLWRTARLRGLLLFVACSALLPLAWFARNQVDVGEALAPLDHVDEDHLALAAQGLRWFGRWRYRGYCLFYWPINVLVLSSPLIGLFSLAGAARALWRRSSGWELAALAWVPAAYFTYRGVVPANFRPMSRFVLVAATLSLPFAWDELLRFTAFVSSHIRALAKHEPLLRRALLTLAILLAVATPSFFFALSYNQNGNTAEWARPLSPVSSVPPGIAQAARYLREHATPDDQILLDGVWDYLEIPLAFESNLPESQFTRLAYDNFEAKLKKVTPTMAVLLYQGNLQYLTGTKDAKWQSPEFEFRGIRFCREAEFVYAGVYRVCRR